MRDLLTNKLLRSRYLLAMVAGVLLGLSFPKLSLAGFAWVAPALMVTAALGRRGFEALRIGYVGGLASYLTSLYWLLLIPDRWHGIPLGPAAGWLALGAYLALYPAAWVWLTAQGRSKRGEGERGETVETSVNIWLASFEAVAGLTWVRRTGWSLWGAAVWVGLEMVVTRLFSGFPWNLLAVSQVELLPLIQICSFAGIYAVSFLIVWTSLSLLSATAMILKRPTFRSAWLGEVALPIWVLAIVFGFGLHQLRQPENAARTVRVTFIQPSIPQTMIWDPSKADERFDDLVRLSKLALTNKTDLVIWPEAAVPKLLYDEKTLMAVTSLARSHHLWIIVGADDAEPRPGATSDKDYLYFNSAFLVGPEGQLMARYRKRNLVIFGEYIPRWLPFLRWFTPIPGDLTAGDHAVPFYLSDVGVKTSVLICFEDVFPDLARDCTQVDTDFLVNITNDGWFGEGSEQWQHAGSARFRAIENGLPLLRCSNNGLTCWIDGRGRLRQVFRDSKGSEYGAGSATMEIPLTEVGQRSPTFYHLHGDWFGWSCVALAVVRLVWRLRPRSKASSKARAA